DADAASVTAVPFETIKGAQDVIAPHRAIYDIKMTSMKRGSQILGVSGTMMYTLKSVCGGWITDHRFNMVYEYSSAPSVRVETKFSSFESFAGDHLDFSSSRSRDGEIYEKIRGKAVLDLAQGAKGSADYSIPAETHYDLGEGTLFPLAHTYSLISEAQRGKKIVHAIVFDGSDDQGAVEINAVIGKKIAPKNASDMKQSSGAEKIDSSLTDYPAWTMGLAVFPLNKVDSVADYELSMDVLENGIVREMKVDYHDFSISQKLIALEKTSLDTCKE
ncbi:MAG TPA: DUF1849 family protein, partial [Alphaproteobacteria bacterium]|nr:DUF1849 family protein [Alphaproteobacteria bacterium]